jgi:hypothetical protein
VSSGGRGARKRQPVCPTGRGAVPNISRRTALRIPSAAHDEVVLAAAAVAELHRDGAVGLGEAVDAAPQPDRHVGRPVEQRLVQVGAVQCEARADAGPERADVDLEEQAAAMVAEALALDLDRTRGDLPLESERAEGTRSVAGQVHAGAGTPPCRLALDQLDRDARPRERARQRQAGDPATGDQHAPSARHHRLGTMFWLSRNRLPGS